jgi:hypothetical protein
MTIREARSLDESMNRGTDDEPAASGPDHRFESLYRAQFIPMVRLAHLLGSDDPENAVDLNPRVAHTVAAHRAAHIEMPSRVGLQANPGISVCVGQFCMRRSRAQP